MQGGVQAGGRENEILVANKFKAELEKDAVFSGGIEKLEISFTEGGLGAAAGVPGAADEKKTIFTLIGSPRAP